MELTIHRRASPCPLHLPPPCAHPRAAMTADPPPPARTVTLDLPDEAATAALAARLGAGLRPGDMVALRGDLGSGKTALVRALVRAQLGPGAEVPSPTFTLVQTYDLPVGILWHFDLYRIESPDEVVELDWDEARAAGIVMVEWPDRLGPLLPAERLDLALDFGAAPGARSARLTGHGGWAGRVAALAGRAGPSPSAIQTD